MVAYRQIRKTLFKQSIFIIITQLIHLQMLFFVQSPRKGSLKIDILIVLYIQTTKPQQYFQVMPKGPSQKSSIQKTRKYIRQILQSRQIALKFTSYQSKNTIIYKLNKYNYLDKELHVIDIHTIKYLAQQCKTTNYIQLINLELCQIGDDGIAEFVKGNWQNVRFLNLGKNCLDSRGVESLTKGNFIELKQLDLHDNLLDNSSIQALVKGQWKHLGVLNLNFNVVASTGLTYMIPNKWNKLKCLSLLRNNITNVGIASLVKMNFPNLQKLYLSHNWLTDDCAKVLVKCEWRQLKELELDGNQMGDDSLMHLWKIGCNKLEKLSLFASKTVVINHKEKPMRVPTMGGLKYLCRSPFQNLKMQIHWGKLGQMSKGSFIQTTKVRQIISHSVRITFVK